MQGWWELRHSWDVLSCPTNCGDPKYNFDTLWQSWTLVNNSLDNYGIPAFAVIVISVIEVLEQVCDNHRSCTLWEVPFHLKTINNS